MFFLQPKASRCDPCVFVLLQGPNLQFTPLYIINTPITQLQRTYTITMTFLQHAILFFLTFLMSLYFYYSFKSRRSSLPTNWPIVGMTPSMSWHFHCIHDYTANLLKQNGGTFMYKGPWFANADLLFTSDPDNFNYISSTNFP